MQNRHNLKILSVDDNVENRYLLESVLRGAGYQVTSVTNGVEALDKLVLEGFDLIVADILMPRMDGFELCRRVKQDPARRNIPFVFYTATYTEKNDEELGLSLGASRFIPKPVEPEKFLEVICQVIDEAQKGELKPKLPTEDQETLLRTYHYRLARKLDKKVAQLEALSHDLRATAEAREHELVERRSAEAQVRALNIELENRVKARTNELAIANRGLEAFVAAVSHDLRSPLLRISCFVEILIKDHAKELPDESRDHLNRISAESRRMGDLVAALLKLSRATHSALHIEKIDLSQIASEIVSDLQPQHPDKPVELVVARGLFAKGDPVLLCAALQNLLENAWKFTRRKEHPRIEFGVVTGEPPAYFVRDNGAGFDSHRASEVFTAFHRLHSDKEFPGSGIGLATVQQIISRHGGRVWAEGAPDKGATFYFTLP